MKETKDTNEIKCMPLEKFHTKANIFLAKKFSFANKFVDLQRAKRKFTILKKILIKTL